MKGDADCGNGMRAAKVNREKDSADYYPDAAARRRDALRWREAGLTYREIGRRLGVTGSRASGIVEAAKIKRAARISHDPANVHAMSFRMHLREVWPRKNKSISAVHRSVEVKSAHDFMRLLSEVMKERDELNRHVQQLEKRHADFRTRLISATLEAITDAQASGGKTVLNDETPEEEGI